MFSGKITPGGDYGRVYDLNSTKMEMVSKNNKNVNKFHKDIDCVFDSIKEDIDVPEYDGTDYHRLKYFQMLKEVVNCLHAITNNGKGEFMVHQVESKLHRACHGDENFYNYGLQLLSLKLYPQQQSSPLTNTDYGFSANISVTPPPKISSLQNLLISCVFDGSIQDLSSKIDAQIVLHRCNNINNQINEIKNTYIRKIDQYAVNNNCSTEKKNVLRQMFNLLLIPATSTTCAVVLGDADGSPVTVILNAIRSGNMVLNTDAILAIAELMYLQANATYAADHPPSGVSKSQHEAQIFYDYQQDAGGIKTQLFEQILANSSYSKGICDCVNLGDLLFDRFMFNRELTLDLIKHLHRVGVVFIRGNHESLRRDGAKLLSGENTTLYPFNIFSRNLEVSQAVHIVEPKTAQFGFFAQDAKKPILISGKDFSVVSTTNTSESTQYRLTDSGIGKMNDYIEFYDDFVQRYFTRAHLIKNGNIYELFVHAAFKKNIAAKNQIHVGAMEYAQYRLLKDGREGTVDTKTRKVVDKPVKLGVDLQSGTRTSLEDISIEIPTNLRQLEQFVNRLNTVYTEIDSGFKPTLNDGKDAVALINSKLKNSGIQINMHVGHNDKYKIDDQVGINILNTKMSDTVRGVVARTISRIGG